MRGQWAALRYPKNMPDPGLLVLSLQISSRTAPAMPAVPAAKLPTEMFSLRRVTAVVVSPQRDKTATKTLAVP